MTNKVSLSSSDRVNCFWQSPRWECTEYEIWNIATHLVNFAGTTALELMWQIFFKEKRPDISQLENRIYLGLKINRIWNLKLCWQHRWKLSGSLGSYVTDLLWGETVAYPQVEPDQKMDSINSKGLKLTLKGWVNIYWEFWYFFIAEKLGMHAKMSCG